MHYQHGAVAARLIDSLRWFIVIFGESFHLITKRDSLPPLHPLHTDSTPLVPCLPAGTSSSSRVTSEFQELKHLHLTDWRRVWRDICFADVYVCVSQAIIKSISNLTQKNNKFTFFHRMILMSGACFYTVLWNTIMGRFPGEGIREEEDKTKQRKRKIYSTGFLVSAAHFHDGNRKWRGNKTPIFS